MSGKTEFSEAEKKMLKNLQNDLRNLSTEAKKKCPPLKEAAEACIIKVRNASSKQEDLRQALLLESAEIIEPFFLGCDPKNPKIVQLCLSAIQRLITFEAVSKAAAGNIINCLWTLMESGTEELKLLQTVTLLLTTNSVVQGEDLAKALVLCFRLHFTKNATTNNTASATVRHLVSMVFERVQTEDASAGSDDQPQSPNIEQLKVGSKFPPKSLRPCAADAFLLFQDMVQLVNADQPFWLVGLTEMTRTFGLELLESVLITYSDIFLQHWEFSFLLKERVCPLIIKLFSPNIKYRQQGGQMAAPLTTGGNTTGDRPYFPITMRLLRIVSVLIHKYYTMLVTECEIFLSLVVKFLEGEKPSWQRAVALEVLYKLCIHPDLIKSFCQCYDMKPHSTKIFQDIVNALGSCVQVLFSGVPSASSSSGATMQGQQPTSGLPYNNPGATPQPAFYFRGVWLPLVLPTSSCKPVFIEMLDKMESPSIPEGYGITLTYLCLLEVVKNVASVVESSESIELKKQLISSSWCGLLAAFALLLEASTDESATESILKSMQVYSSLCGQLELTMPRDAFITTMCKGSLPPHYTLTVLNAGLPKDNIRGLGAGNQDFNNPVGGVYLGGDPMEIRQQVVAVGTPLPTASLPLGAQQGPVMLTSKNLQCMRAVLSLAHSHGAVLGNAWRLVLTTLQHLVWILGLKPSTGGSLKASNRTADAPNAVITTAVMADLPVLSSMLSRLFENSQNLNDVALHHLIDALCQLSTESMELAYTNREPSLFAVAKLLETGLVNLDRVEVLWKPVTSHLLEVCQHPHIRMREWGAEAITYLVKAALTHKHSTPLQENHKLQTVLLSPLCELSTVPHPDVRQKQLDCVLQILQTSGEVIPAGWPQILHIIGAISDNQGEALIRCAFQCIQLVGADFLPTLSNSCLQLCIDTLAKFGSQSQELNVALTAIGQLWNIADYLFQSQQGDGIATVAKAPEECGELWMCVFARLGELCVDPRPAVRKSAGQTLFSTLTAHGALLPQELWQAVLWRVLFALLERVRSHSTAASADRIAEPGNLLIHHSRNTAQKQWAETQVLTLSGVARIFHLKRDVLQNLGDFSRAWALLLDYIEASALSTNNEVSFSALKSFQEILNIPRQDEDWRDPQREGGNISEDNSTMWAVAWKVWYNIGVESTKPPPDNLVEEAANKGDYSLLYIPSQPFLTALVQIFPYLFQHLKARFTASDFQKLATVLQNSVAVPVHSEASPFILPSLNEVVLTPLQESVLHAMEILHKEVLLAQGTHLTMLPAIFSQLLTFVSYACHAPPYGKLRTLSHKNAKANTADWVTMNFVPFGERCLELVVSLYQVTATLPCVVNAGVLHSIVKTLRIPLSLKYDCPSHYTWKLALNSLLKVLHVGLPVAMQQGQYFEKLWPELASTLEEFLFSASPPPAVQTLEEQQLDEALDCKIVQMIRDSILPHCAQVPKDFVVKIVAILNQGSIHSATNVDLAFPDEELIPNERDDSHNPHPEKSSHPEHGEVEPSRRLREEFAKACFETLLQFSFLGSTLGVNQLAVTSLLTRFQEVVCRYAQDERLSGKCPLPRHRMAEISFVLKAIATLTSSLKKAPPENVEWNVWQQLIALYPHLVDCTTSTSPQVCRSLRLVLHEYADLLVPPPSHHHMANGTS